MEKAENKVLQKGEGREVKKEELEVLEGDVEDSSYLIKLKRPFSFEGKMIEEIDLGGMEDLTSKDMVSINRKMERDGGFSVNPELTVEYACHIASKATGFPLELFYKLNPKDAIVLKSKVTRFFYSED